MGEIITPLVELEDGEPYVAEEGDFVIQAEHTISDIVRHMIEHGSNAEEIAFLACSIEAGVEEAELGEGDED